VVSGPNETEERALEMVFIRALIERAGPGVEVLASTPEAPLVQRDNIMAATFILN